MSPKLVEMTATGLPDDGVGAGGGAVWLNASKTARMTNIGALYCLVCAAPPQRAGNARRGPCVDGRCSRRPASEHFLGGCSEMDSSGVRSLGSSPKSRESALG